MKVLSHMPNYAVVTRYPPVAEYVASIEQACTQLKQGKAEELREEVKTILKKIQPPQVQHHKRIKNIRRAEEEQKQDHLNC